MAIKRNQLIKGTKTIVPLYERQMLAREQAMREWEQRRQMISLFDPLFNEAAKRRVAAKYNTDYNILLGYLDLIANNIKPYLEGRPGQGILRNLQLIGDSVDQAFGAIAIKSFIAALIKEEDPIEYLKRAYGLGSGGRYIYDTSYIRESLGIDLGTLGNTLFDLAGEILLDPSTYFSLGASSTAKGVIKRAINTLDEIPDLAKPKYLERLARLALDNNKDEFINLFRRINKAVKLEDIETFYTTLRTSLKQADTTVRKVWSFLDRLDDALVKTSLHFSPPWLVQRYVFKPIRGRIGSVLARNLENTQLFKRFLDYDTDETSELFSKLREKYKNNLTSLEEDIKKASDAFRANPTKETYENVQMLFNVFRHLSRQADEAHQRFTDILQELRLIRRAGKFTDTNRAIELVRELHNLFKDAPYLRKLYYNDPRNRNIIKLIDQELNRQIKSLNESIDSILRKMDKIKNDPHLTSKSIEYRLRVLDTQYKSLIQERDELVTLSRLPESSSVKTLDYHDSWHYTEQDKVFLDTVEHTFDANLTQEEHIELLNTRRQMIKEVQDFLKSIDPSYESGQLASLILSNSGFARSQGAVYRTLRLYPSVFNHDNWLKPDTLKHIIDQSYAIHRVINTHLDVDRLSYDLAYIIYDAPIKRLTWHTIKRTSPELYELIVDVIPYSGKGFDDIFKEAETIHQSLKQIRKMEDANKLFKQLKNLENQLRVYKRFPQDVTKKDTYYPIKYDYSKLIKQTETHLELINDAINELTNTIKTSDDLTKQRLKAQLLYYKSYAYEVNRIAQALKDVQSRVPEANLTRLIPEIKNIKNPRTRMQLIQHVFNVARRSPTPFFKRQVYLDYFITLLKNYHRRTELVEQTLFLLEQTEKFYQSIDPKNPIINADKLKEIELLSHQLRIIQSKQALVHFTRNIDDEALKNIRSIIDGILKPASYQERVIASRNVLFDYLSRLGLDSVDRILGSARYFAEVGKKGTLEQLRKDPERFVIYFAIVYALTLYHTNGEQALNLIYKFFDELMSPVVTENNIKRFITQRQQTLQELADKLGVSTNSLRTLNPHLEDIIKPNTSVRYTKLTRFLDLTYEFDESDAEIIVNKFETLLDELDKILYIDERAWDTYVYLPQKGIPTERRNAYVFQAMKHQFKDLIQHKTALHQRVNGFNTVLQRPPHLNFKLKDPNVHYIFMDIETTGLQKIANDKQPMDQIIEAAAQSFRFDENGQLVVYDRFRKGESKLVRLEAGRKLNQKITELTGITFEMLQDESLPTLDYYIRELAEYIVRTVRSGKPTVIVAHNAEFDWTFFINTLKQFGYYDTYANDLNQVVVLDTLGLARYAAIKSENFQEQTLINFLFGDVSKIEGFNELLDEADLGRTFHSANYDSAAGVFLFKALLDHVEHVETLEDLIEFRNTSMEDALNKLQFTISENGIVAVHKKLDDSEIEQLRTYVDRYHELLKEDRLIVQELTDQLMQQRFLIVYGQQNNMSLNELRKKSIFQFAIKEFKDLHTLEDVNQYIQTLLNQPQFTHKDIYKIQELLFATLDQLVDAFETRTDIKRFIKEQFALIESSLEPSYSHIKSIDALISYYDQINKLTDLIKSRNALYNKFKMVFTLDGKRIETASKEAKVYTLRDFIKFLQYQYDALSDYRYDFQDYLDERLYNLLNETLLDLNSLSYDELLYHLETLIEEYRIVRRKLKDQGENLPLEAVVSYGSLEDLSALELELEFEETDAFYSPSVRHERDQLYTFFANLEELYDILEWVDRNYNVDRMLLEHYKQENIGYGYIIRNQNLVNIELMETIIQSEAIQSIYDMITGKAEVFDEGTVPNLFAEAIREFRESTTYKTQEGYDLIDDIKKEFDAIYDSIEFFEALFEPYVNHPQAPISYIYDILNRVDFEIRQFLLWRDYRFAKSNKLKSPMTEDDILDLTDHIQRTVFGGYISGDIEPFDGWERVMSLVLDRVKTHYHNFIVRPDKRFTDSLYTKLKRLADVLESRLTPISRKVSEEQTVRYSQEHIAQLRALFEQGVQDIRDVLKRTKLENRTNRTPVAINNLRMLTEMYEGEFIRKNSTHVFKYPDELKRQQRSRRLLYETLKGNLADETPIYKRSEKPVKWRPLDQDVLYGIYENLADRLDVDVDEFMRYVTRYTKKTYRRLQNIELYKRIVPLDVQKSIDLMFLDAQHQLSWISDLEEQKDRVLAAYADILNRLYPSDQVKEVNQLFRSAHRLMYAASETFGDLLNIFGDRDEALLRYLQTEKNYMLVTLDGKQNLKHIRLKSLDDVHRLKFLHEQGNLFVLVNKNDYYSLKKFFSKTKRSKFHKYFVTLTKMYSLLNFSFLFGNIVEGISKNLISGENPLTLWEDFRSAHRSYELWMDYYIKASKANELYEELGWSAKYNWMDWFFIPQEDGSYMTREIIVRHRDTGEIVEVIKPQKVTQEEYTIIKRTNDFFVSEAGSVDMQEFSKNIEIFGKERSKIRRIYKVKSGDRLETIAERFKVSIEQLKEVNENLTDILEEGQEIHIPKTGIEFSDVLFYNRIIQKNFQLNTKVEGISRYALYLNSVRHGLTEDEALAKVLNTFFSYGAKSQAEVIAEFVIPFISFPIRNFIYFMEMMENPAVAKTVARAVEAAWADLEISSNEYLDYKLSVGAIPVSDQLLYDTNLGILEAFSFVGDPFNTFKRKLHPIIKLGLAGIQSVQQGSDELLVKQALRMPIASNIVRGVHFATNLMQEEKTLDETFPTLFSRYYTYSNYYYPRMNVYQNLYTKTGMRRWELITRKPNYYNMKYKIRDILYRSRYSPYYIKRRTFTL